MKRLDCLAYKGMLLSFLFFMSTAPTFCVIRINTTNGRFPNSWCQFKPVTPAA